MSSVTLGFGFIILTLVVCVVITVIVITRVICFTVTAAAALVCDVTGCRFLTKSGCFVSVVSVLVFTLTVISMRVIDATSE